ncbi:hypothetical protein, partial [Hyphomonas oceanitis]
IAVPAHPGRRLIRLRAELEGGGEAPVRDLEPVEFTQIIIGQDRGKLQDLVKVAIESDGLTIRTRTLVAHLS